jgi:hypothetical protein
MRNKYNARKIVIDGYTFDSLAEGRRYQDLKYSMNEGLISDLRIHPHFDLFPATKHGANKLSAIGYTADFQYREGDETVVEDVKGMITRDASLRMNLFQRQYPGVDFRIIKR